MRRQLGSTFEMLEPRLAMTISAALPPVFDPNNLSNGAHIHPILTLIENGQQLVIPAGVGVNAAITSFSDPHTHDFTGKLHIGEGPAPDGTTRNITLKDFFDVWHSSTLSGSRANSSAILDTNPADGAVRFMDKTIDSTHVLRMYVKETSDSAPELEYDSSASSNGIARPELYVPRDGDQIIIDYELKTQVAFAPSFSTIANQTVLGGAPTWLGINGIDADGGPLTYTVSSSNPNLVQAIIPTGNKSLVLNTSNNTEVQYGQMVFQLFDNLAPNTTHHIETLVTNGEFATNSTFYRIANSGSSPFVIQGGPSNSASSLGAMDDEFNADLQFTTAGLLAMAKSTDDTGDSQVFVTAGPTRFLDFQHSIFGVLTEGDAVRQAIQASRTSGDGAPPNTITIDSAQIITDTQNAALELKAAPGASGQADITVTVKDAQNHTYSQTFHVTVTPDSNNPAPFLGTIAPVTGVTGQPVTLQLSATDVQHDEVQLITRNANGNTIFSFNGVNATTPVNFTFTPGTSNPPVAATGTSAGDVQAALSTIPALNGNIAVTGGAGGPYTVTFIGALANQNVATIGVNNSNATVTTLDPLFFDASKPSGESVNYSVDVNHSTGLVTITPPANFSGNFHLNVGVRGTAQRSTADQFDTESVLVTVSSPAPTGIDLDTASDSGASSTDNITNASSLNFTVSGVTSGATVKLLKGTTILAQGQATGSTITLNIANPGSVLGQGASTLTATQTNNGQESAASTPLNVTYDTTVPSFTSTAPTAAQVGFNLNYNAQTNEEGGTSGLTYSLTGVNNLGATINASTGVVSWTPSSTQTGPQSFTVVATDAAGNTASQPLNLTVSQSVVDVKLTLTKPDGSPLTSLAIGQDFVLHVFAQDLRTTPQGVFALYNDITFDGSLATVTGPLTYGANYPNGRSGTAATGLIDEAGAFTTSSNLGGNALEVYSVPMRATAVGTLTIATDPAEDTPQHDVLVLGQNASVTDAQIHYGTASIEVGSTFNAVNDTFTATEDTQNNTINPLANDTNVGSNTNTLTISAVGTPNHGGVVTISSDNKSLKYTPAANFSGAETFTYTAKNQNNETHTATITMNVADANDAPVATNDTFNVPRNSTGNVLNVLANDTTGVDTGETLRVSAVGTGNHGGTITIGTNGANILYTPAANFSGTETFTYTISDRAAGVSGALTSQGSVTVSISGLIANNDSGTAFTFDEDSGAHTLDVLTNDVADPQVPNSVLTITSVGTTDHGGVVTINQDNTHLTYTSAANFQGAEKFTYTISDGQGHSATATVTMTINNVNDAPTATNDTLSAFKNTQATFDVLANDTSTPDPTETLTLDSIVTAPQNGTATIVNGKIQYTPNSGYTGADSFTYKIKDPGGLTSTATANITVQDFQPSVLSGFVYFDVNNNGIKDATEIALVGITITLTGTATAGSNTTANGINLTTKTGEDGSYKFENLAPGTYSVTESQPLFVIDGKVKAGSQGGTTGANKITITNMAQNTAGTNNNFGELGRALTTISLRDFFSSTSKNYAYVAFDNSGNELWHAATGTVWQGFSKHAFSLINTKTQIELDSTNAQSQIITRKLDTSLPVYQAGTSGTNRFYYFPGGPSGTSSAAANLPPVGVADAFSTTQNTALTKNAADGVLKNDSDPEAHTLTASKVSDPAHGTLTLNSDGSFTYTPTTGFTGTDTFTYKASDGTNQSAATTVTMTVTATNTTPTAVADTFSATEDTILTKTAATGVLSNDTGSNLTAVKVTDPTKGTLNLASDGSFTYVPTANLTGTDTFTYKAVSGSTESAPVTVTINISAVNDNPVAVNHNYSATKNTAFTPPSGNTLLTNATDAENDPLSVVTTAVSGPANGTLTLNSDGTFTYTPANNFVGTDSFTYKINDTHSDSAPATVTITVNPPANHAPVAVNDTFNPTEDTNLTVGAESGVLSNDTDADSGDQAILTATQVTGPTHGTLTLNSDGSFTYHPDANFNGTDSFTYKANDGHTASNLSNVATVTLTVGSVNDLPVGVADSYRVNPDANLTVNATDGVLKNDTDVETLHQNLTATIVTQPAHGTVVLNSDGSFTYTSKQDGFGGGPDPFTYTVSDDSSPAGVSTATTVTIVVDTPPHAHNQPFTTAEDTPLTMAAPGLLFHDFDDENDQITAILVNQPAHGTVTLNANGAFTYTPSANFFGTDTFRYQASDGIVASGPATITVTVTSVNDVPVANGDGYSVNAGAEIVISPASGVLHNDTDADNSDSDPANDTLTAIIVNPPTHGTFSFNTNGDGGFTYTADANFHGDDSFTYKVNDGHVDSPVATVTLHVNALPAALNDQADTDEDVVLSVDAAHSVLVNDTDVDGTHLTALLIANAQHGNVSLNTDGTFTYTPAANYSGSDSFTYVASDGLGISNVATVALTIHPVNDPPAGAGDSFDVAEGGSLSVAAVDTVLKNDTDIDSAHSSLTAVNATTPANGTLDFHADGTFTYSPSPGFHGSDSFTYQPKDATDTGTATTVTITVHQTPQVANDSYDAIQDTQLHKGSTEGVLVNDLSPEGRQIQAVLASTVSHGTLTLNNDGGFDYLPAPGYTGTDSFTYLASDDVATSSLATVTFNVLPSGGEGESSVNDLALLSYLGLHDNTNQVPDGMWQSAVDQAMEQLG